MKIRKVLDVKGTPDVYCITGSATLSVFVKILLMKGIGCLIVTDDNEQIVGIVSERDLVKCFGEGMDLTTTKICEVMSTEVVTIPLDADIHTAMDLMVGRKIRHLPVMSPNGRCVGLVTVRDLLRAMRQADKDELSTFVRYLERCASDNPVSQDIA